MGVKAMFVAGLAGLAALAAPASAQPSEDCQSLTSVVESNDQLSTFVDLVREAELPAPAEGTQITILAPTNAAIAALGEEALSTLLQPENQGVLATILSDHILPGAAVTAADIVDEGTAEYETANAGVFVTAEASDGTVTFTAPDDGTVATVVTPDLESCVGVLHIIDAVLIRGGSQDEMRSLGAPASVVGVTPSAGPAEAPSVFDVAGTPREVPDIFEPAVAPEGAYGYGDYGGYGGYGGYGYGGDDMAMAPDMA